jgi:uncharacterized protein
MIVPAEFRDLQARVLQLWLGLFGRLSVSLALGLGIIVYILQAITSRWWLAHFRFGPVEWLWRSLMYGTRQPMRIA